MNRFLLLLPFAAFATSPVLPFPLGQSGDLWPGSPYLKQMMSLASLGTCLEGRDELGGLPDAIFLVAIQVSVLSRDTFLSIVKNLVSISANLYVDPLSHCKLYKCSAISYLELMPLRATLTSSSS